jgi:predicted phosphodiesterase
MKIAIFSDVHANIEALEVFVNSTYGRVDMYICLGDIIGYGPDPSKAISIVKSLCSDELAIRGNHERGILNPSNLKKFNSLAAEALIWTMNNLYPSDIDYLASLSDVIEFEDFLFVHGSPRSNDEYIVSYKSALENIELIKKKNKKICFFGHTHIAVIWKKEGGFIPKVDEEIELDPNEYYLINPGSIGQPRDGIPLGGYAIFDDQKYSIVFKRFEYDIDKVYKKIVERGIPEYLGRRLFYGV